MRHALNIIRTWRAKRDLAHMIAASRASFETQDFVRRRAAALKARGQVRA